MAELNKVLQELESLSPDSYLPQSLAKQRIEVAVEQQNNTPIDNNSHLDKTNNQLDKNNNQLVNQNNQLNQLNQLNQSNQVLTQQQLLTSSSDNQSYQWNNQGTVNVQIPIDLVRGAFRNSEESDKKKNRVGRPAKRPQPEVPIAMGIVNSPTIDPDNRVEFKFQSPHIFKQLSTIYKSMNSHEIELKFLAKNITSCVYDNRRGTISYLNIKTDKVISYYCKEDTIIGIKRSRIDDIFTSNNKKDSPAFLFELKNNTYKSILHITTSETLYNTCDNIPVQLINAPEINPILYDEPDWNSYPIKITLPTDLIKRFIVSCKLQSVTLNFDKMNSDNLSMSLYNENAMIKEKKFMSEDKIGLDCSSNDEIISVAVSLLIARPIIAANLADNITIAIDSKKPLMMMYSTPLFTFKQFIPLYDHQKLSY